MSHDLLITSCWGITWQTQTILWPPMLEGVWSIKRGSLPQSHITFHPLYLHYHSAYGRKTWRDCDLPWASSTHKMTWAYNYVALRDTWQTKIIISPLTQCLHNVYNDVYNGYIIWHRWDLQYGASFNKVARPLKDPYSYIWPVCIKTD